MGAVFRERFPDDLSAWLMTEVHINRDMKSNPSQVLPPGPAAARLNNTLQDTVAMRCCAMRLV